MGPFGHLVTTTPNLGREAAAFLNWATIGNNNYSREAAVFLKATNNNNYGREAAAFLKAK